MGCISRSTLGAFGLACDPWSSYQVNQVNKVNKVNKANKARARAKAKSTASEGGWWLMSRPFLIRTETARGC